jgi:biopolymer transport protein ExbB
MTAAVDWLADIAAIAPLVGLLGTVLGMFKAFGGIASDVAAGAKPVVLAQGVSQAIITTIFGLAVAIPCLLAYAFFRRRAQRRIAEIEELADEVSA